MQVQHVYRECNKVVDFMVDLSISQNSGELKVWHLPLRGIDNLLLHDKICRVLVGLPHYQGEKRK